MSFFGLISRFKTRVEDQQTIIDSQSENYSQLSKQLKELGDPQNILQDEKITRGDLREFLDFNQDGRVSGSDFKHFDSNDCDR